MVFLSCLNNGLKLTPFFLRLSKPPTTSQQSNESSSPASEIQLDPTERIIEIFFKEMF